MFSLHLKGSIDVKIEASYCQAPLELHLLHAAGGQGGLRLVPGLQLLPDQTQLPGGAPQHSTVYSTVQYSIQYSTVLEAGLCGGDKNYIRC